YLVVDFVTNRFVNVMNAGIGGWRLSRLLDEDGVNDWNDFYSKFEPDVIINESGTNDDWSYGDRRISRTLNGVTEAELKSMFTLELNSATYNAVSDDYTVVSNTGIITSIS